MSLGAILPLKGGRRFVAGMNGAAGGDGGKRRKETEKSDLIRKRNRLNSSFHQKCTSFFIRRPSGWVAFVWSVWGRPGEREREREVVARNLEAVVNSGTDGRTDGRTERTPIEESGGVGDNPFQTKGLFRHSRADPASLRWNSTRIETWKTRISKAHAPPVPVSQSKTLFKGAHAASVASSPTLARFPFPGEI